MMRRVALAAIAVAVLLVASSAFAHALGVSRGEYTLAGDRVDASLVFRADELGTSMTAAEVVASTLVSADGAPCPSTFDGATPDAPDGLRITAHFTCPRSPRHLRVHEGFLERLSSGHAHVATIVDGSTKSEHLAVLAKPDVDVDLAAPSTGFFGFIREGIGHILTGADHLLFLLGLVLLKRDTKTKPRERVRAVVLVLTAFTLGHSVSLAIATLGGFAPSARIVEPLVALSVAWVGAENLFARGDLLARRWLVTLPFGLVHGFAFASGLLLVRLPKSELPMALFGFNLGVELGQLVVMAIVLPLLFLLSRRARPYDLVRAVTSAGVLGCGLVWFVQRLL